MCEHQNPYPDCQDTLRCSLCHEQIFEDGDKVEGSYGNVWTRQGGYWTGVGDTEHSDDTMWWLINLAIDSPPTIWYPKKLSKTGAITYQGFQYKYRLRRHDA